MKRVCGWNLKYSIKELLTIHACAALSCIYVSVRAAPQRTAHTAHHIFWYSDLVLVVRLKNLYVSSIFVIACAQTCCD
jgi:hypothetical protein